MGVDRAIDITAKQRKTVTALLERHLPGKAAWIYGSRAKWTARLQSDLDLVVFATPEQNGRIGALREAFEESDLPFRVDLFVWDEVPDEFRKQIEAEHVVLVERRKRTTDSAWRETVYGMLSTDFLEDSLANLCCHDNGVQTGPFGSQLHQKDYVPVGIPILTVEHLGENRVVHQDLPHVSDYDRERLSKFTLRKGDIVFSRVGSVDRRALVREAESGWLFSGRCLRVRPDPSKIDSGYLSYFFGWASFREHIRSIAVGATMPSLNTKILSDIVVPCPPLHEQRAIAHILGTLDDKIELNGRMNETLEALARALFTSWFVTFDPVRAKMAGRDPSLPKHIADLFPDRFVESEMGEIPKGWKVGTLEDVASLNPESWSTRNAPEEIVYVDLSNTKWGCIEKLETYPWKAAPSRGRRVLRRGDTIVGTVRPGNGSFSLIGRDGLTGSTGFAVLRPQTPSDTELIWCAATSQDNIDRLTHLADGGAYPAVRPEAIAATKLPLADFDTRAAFSSVAASLLNQANANRQQSHTLAALRNTLLPKLISGEVRVQVAGERVEEAM